MTPEELENRRQQELLGLREPHVSIREHFVVLLRFMGFVIAAVVLMLLVSCLAWAL